MNMEIMLWAAINGGNAAYPDYVEGYVLISAIQESAKSLSFWCRQR